MGPGPDNFLGKSTPPLGRCVCQLVPEVIPEVVSCGRSGSADVEAQGEPVVPPLPVVFDDNPFSFDVGTVLVPGFQLEKRQRPLGSNMFLFVSEAQPQTRIKTARIATKTTVQAPFSDMPPQEVCIRFVEFNLFMAAPGQIYDIVTTKTVSSNLGHGKTNETVAKEITLE